MSSSGTLDDASTGPDASATGDAGATFDATASLDAGSADGSEGASCRIPASARSSNPDGPGGCTPNPAIECDGCPQWCDSSEYLLACYAGTVWGGPPSPNSSLGCAPTAGVAAGGGAYYCCPCEGADVAEPDAAPNCDGGAAPYSIDAGRCVSVNLSSYDRSCASDSECTAISVGTVCNGGCRGACPNAAINVRDRACYEQTIPQPPGGDMFCECGNIAAPDARCINGICTFCQQPWDCQYSEWTAATEGLDAQALAEAGPGDAPSR